MDDSDLKLLAEIERRDKRIADLEHSRATLVELRDKRIAELERLLKVRTEALEEVLYKWLISHSDGEPDPLDSGLYEETYTKLGLPARTAEYRDRYLAHALSQGSGGT